MKYLIKRPVILYLKLDSAKNKSSDARRLDIHWLAIFSLSWVSTQKNENLYLKNFWMQLKLLW